MKARTDPLSQTIIVLAFDNRFYSDELVKKIKGFYRHVVFCKSAGIVLDLIENPRHATPKIIVIDDQLTHDARLSVIDTEDGTATGTALYRYLRAKHYDQPIIIYTTRHENYQVLQAYAAEDENLVVIRTYTDLYDKVVRALDKFLPSGKE